MIDLSKSTPKNHKNHSGFSIIELAIVMVVAAIIAANAVPLYRSNIRKGYEASAVSSLKLMVHGETVARSTGGYINLQELHDRGSLDDSFLDGDNNNSTLKKHGYIFQITTDGSENLVISAIPEYSSALYASGDYRFGTDSGGIIFRDRENLTAHFTTSTELRSGTSSPVGDK